MSEYGIGEASPTRERNINRLMQTFGIQYQLVCPISDSSLPDVCEVAHGSDLDHRARSMSLYNLPPTSPHTSIFANTQLPNTKHNCTPMHTYAMAIVNHRKSKHVSAGVDGRRGATRSLQDEHGQVMMKSTRACTRSHTYRSLFVCLSHLVLYCYLAIPSCILATTSS